MSGDQEKIDALQTRIASINSRLDSAATSYDVDGMKGTIDLDQLRQQRRDLEKELADLQAGSAPSSGFRPLTLGY